MHEQGDHRLGGDLRERLRDRVRSVHLVSFSWPGPQRPIKKLIFFLSPPWQEASRRRGCHQRRRRGDWRRGGDQRVRFAPSVSFCFASCLTRAACLPYLTLQEGQRRRGGGQRQRRGNRVCTHFSVSGHGLKPNLLFLSSWQEGTRRRECHQRPRRGDRRGAGDQRQRPNQRVSLISPSVSFPYASSFLPSSPSFSSDHHASKAAVGGAAANSGGAPTGRVVNG